MTVATATRKQTYAGDDADTTFPYSFKIFVAADIVVTLIVDATSVETVQTLTTHYTLTGINDDAGGIVTMITAPATGETLRVERVLTFTQLTNFRIAGSFLPEAHEKALDYLTMLAQQLDEEAFQSLPLDTTQGPADVTTRGRMKFITGGAGVADQFIVVMKDSLDAYDWILVIDGDG